MQTDPIRAEDAEIYRQLNARFLNLNDTLYKIPPIVSTIIGGLWYFGTTQIHASQPYSSIAVFAFAALVGLTGALLLRRIDPRMQDYQARIAQHEGRAAYQGARGPNTVAIMMALMYSAITLSLLGVLFVLHAWLQRGLVAS